MQKWLISADTEKGDHRQYLAECGFIFWNKGYNYEIGDIVYIYSKKPVAKVIFKTCVEEISSNNNSDKDWVKFKLIEYIDNDELSLENLRKYGLKNPPMGAMKLKGDLEKYIDNFFERDFNEDKTPRIWLIKAGEEGVKIDAFKKDNFVAIGWEFGDLKGKSRDEIKVLCGDGRYEPNSCLFQINAFVNEIKFGDYILTYNNLKKEFHIGKCISDYYFSEKKDKSGIDDKYKNCRDVVWSDVIIKMENISQKNLKFINLPGTINEIKNINAKEEIINFYNFICFFSEDKRNLIYFGAPGTGKSFNLNKHKDELIKKYKNNIENNYERVTFHPDYTYANFVGTYKPVVGTEKIVYKHVIENNNEITHKPVIENNDITYKYIPGPFMRTLIKALKNPLEPFVLIIEEINRANVAAVFGDVFQLLDRDEFYNSKYPIDASEDIKKYIRNELDFSNVPEYKQCTIRKYWYSLLGENINKIKIPSNMFIWATMNSADQGVFPMDTAFKRRWDFKYFDIHNEESVVENLKVNLNNKEFSWNQIRNAINAELISYGINEDKLIGPFFAFNEYILEDFSEKKVVQIKPNEFKEIFKNKIIMYLFEDVARAKRDVLFKGALNRQKNKNNITYYQICDDFKDNELKIFSKNIRNKLNLGE